VLDRQRLEKTLKAPFANDSDTPGLRSAVQNKASALPSARASSHHKLPHRPNRSHSKLG